MFLYYLNNFDHVVTQSFHSFNQLETEITEVCVLCFSGTPYPRKFSKHLYGKAGGQKTELNFLWSSWEKESKQSQQGSIFKQKTNNSEDSNDHHNLSTFLPPSKAVFSWCAFLITVTLFLMSFTLLKTFSYTGSFNGSDSSRMKTRQHRSHKMAFYILLIKLGIFNHLRDLYCTLWIQDIITDYETVLRPTLFVWENRQLCRKNAFTRLLFILSNGHNSWTEHNWTISWLAYPGIRIDKMVWDITFLDMFELSGQKLLLIRIT